MAPFARGLACLAFTVLCAGCSSGGYTVVVRFEPASIAGDAPRVQLALVGGCAAQGRAGEEAVGVLETVDIRRGAGSVALGDAPPGTYGLYVRAWSATCHVVAAGCADVTLVAGGEGELVVTARGIAGPACPSGTACADGTCRSPDAGGPPPPDGGSTDAGPGPGLDAGECAAGGGAVSCWTDVDGDGYARADATPASFCGTPSGCPPGTTDVAPTATLSDCNDALPDVRPGARDVCNGVDDDCDPATADGDAEPDRGMPCDGSDADLCTEGSRGCVSGAPACSDTTGDAVERCNGVDDDCDGMIDGAPACADGCTGVVRPGTTRSYMFCRNPRPFATAATACVANGMRLVRIDDASEDAWILGTFVASLGTARYWIGAVDAPVDGDWHWIDGTPFWLGDSAGTPIAGVYSNWAPGQPSGGAAEACGDGRPDSAGRWGDADCTLAAPFVCEEY